MSEIARLLRAISPKPEVVKVRRPKRPPVRIGSRVTVYSARAEFVVVERDPRYKNAWFVEDLRGRRAPYSLHRDDFEVLS